MERRITQGQQSKPPRISIQGYEGSFHQVAARQFFGKDVEVIPCANFPGSGKNSILKTGK